MATSSTNACTGFSGTCNDLNSTKANIALFTAIAGTGQHAVDSRPNVQEPCKKPSSPCLPPKHTGQRVFCPWSQWPNPWRASQPPPPVGWISGIPIVCPDNLAIVLFGKHFSTHRLGPLHPG